MTGNALWGVNELALYPTYARTRLSEDSAMMRDNRAGEPRIDTVTASDDPASLPPESGPILQWAPVVLVQIKKDIRG